MGQSSGKSPCSKGIWGFFSPCIYNGTGKPQYTNSIVGLGRGASGCGQLTTVGSPLGTAIAVSPSWQLGYGSLPFTSANK
jgi:hypothetical protein